jgi:hypothetical protein
MADRSLGAAAARFGAAGLVFAACVAASQAHATSNTFAQFTEQKTGPGTANISFKNGTLTTKNGGDPVFFNYTDLLGPLPTGLEGQLSANLTITATSLPASSLAVPGLGTIAIQPFSTITLAFTLPTDFIYKGVDYGNNLLTMTATPVSPANDNVVALTGNNGSKTATANFDSGFVDVSYSSSFLDFSDATGNGASLSLSSVLQSFGLTKNHTYVNNFTADMTGTFASDPPKLAVFVPEPISATLLGVGLIGLGTVRRRRIF